MIRNLKALGLALVAVFALSALAASSASAADKITVAGGGSAILTGSGTNNIFKITSPNLEVKCTTVSTSAATITSGATSVTTTPSYTGKENETPHGTKCNSSLGDITVDMNGCHYILSGETTGSDNGTDATVSIECDKAGEHIYVTTSVGCTLKIPAQTSTSGGVVYRNVAGSNPTDIEIEATVTGITYTTTGAFCGLGGLSSEANNADYNGIVTVKGYEDNNGVEGAQVGIESS